MKHCLTILLSVFLITCAVEAAQIEKITGKIENTEFAVDGNPETAATLKKVGAAEQFDFIIYLDGDSPAESVELNLSALPENISLSGSTDIVTWQDISQSVEHRQEGAKYKVVITTLDRVYARFLRIKMKIQGAEEVKLFEVAIKFAGAVRNEITDAAVTAVDDHSVDITYRTEYPTQTQVRYGMDNTVFDQVNIVKERVKEHKVALTGLLAGTEYYYQILVDDIADISKIMTFKTTGDPFPIIKKIDMPDPMPDRAVISMSANKPVRWRLKWGFYVPGMTFNDAISRPDAGEVSSQEFISEIKIPLLNLTPRKRYFFVVAIEDGAGNVAGSQVLGFDTTPVNLALGAAVDGTFTHEIDDKYIQKTDKPLARVTDGDLNYFTGFAKSKDTREGDQWIQIDMGKDSDVAETLVVWSSLAIPEDYTVASSVDGTAWETILDVKDGKYPESATTAEKRSPRGDPLTEVTIVADRKIRYIRLSFPRNTKIISDFGWKYAVLAEIKALAPEAK